MTTRIGWSAGGIAFASAAILALFQVQGWKMWPWVAVTLLAVLIMMGVIFVLIFIHALWGGFFGRTRSYGLRWPVFRKDAPSPDQWLLDIAKHDADSPTEFLHILDRYVSNKDLSADLPMPWIELAVELYNCNVHNVVVGAATGRATFNSKELPEAIVTANADGKTKMPRGARHHYKMKQYLTPDYAAQLYQEIVEETQVCGGQRRKEVRSLELSGVSIEVECSGRSVSMPLSGVTRFWYS